MVSTNNEKKRKMASLTGPWVKNIMGRTPTLCRGGVLTDFSQASKKIIRRVAKNILFRYTVTKKNHSVSTKYCVKAGKYLGYRERERGGKEEKREKREERVSF